MAPNPELMAFISRLLPPMTHAISLFIPGRDSRVAEQYAKNNAAIIQLVAHVSAVLPHPDSRATQEERRRYPRVPLDLAIGCVFGGATFPAQGEDISAEGLLIRSESTVAPGSEISLAISAPGSAEPIHSKARVTRATGGRLGLKFVNPLFGPFEALWALEGLGHWYADSFYERGELPHELLTGGAEKGLPETSLTMLHAGIGMSFAKRTLERLKPSSPAADIRRAIETVVELCRDSSQPGYAGCAVESLGLAARFLHGAEMVRAIDEQLSMLRENLRETLLGYLWHGAGRAMYFSPQNLMPAWRTPWRAVAMSRSEPPHELGRRNAAAGFAWAITLVNMRFPEIMETLLQHHGEEFSQDDAFSNGVMSSLIVRYDVTPGDPTLAAFRQHRPTGAGEKVAALWDRLVRDPGDLALNQYYPVVKDKLRLEDVFRYQDIGALVGQLRQP